MAELEHIDVARMIRNRYRFYAILSGEDKWRGRSIPDATHFTPLELLELATWIEQNRAQLEQEAQEDEARNARAWSEDMKDMEKIKNEWRAYRDEGTGALAYNTEMDRRNRIIAESVEKPWLPLHDGE